jgi:hypothetical protein
MFSKIYRIATKFYGNPRPEAFEDAMISYASCYFEGKNVFYADDPGDVECGSRLRLHRMTTRRLPIGRRGDNGWSW